MSCLYANIFLILILDSWWLQPKDMVEFLVLINQVICKFNSSVASMLEEIFPSIASRLFNTLSSDAFPSGPGSNTDVRMFTQARLS